MLWFFGLGTDCGLDEVGRVTDWDQRFLDMAKLVGSWSRDPSTKVGAVITKGKFVVSLGFNGHPAGLPDTLERLENREEKYKTILHAELNAILTSRRDLNGCTIYIWPYLCCSQCAAVIIQSGIKQVVVPFRGLDRWGESAVYLKESGVELKIKESV